MITHVRTAVMYVADQAASVDFYVNKLGFILERDEEMFPGARWIQIRPPESRTSIVLSSATAFGKQPGEGAYLHFACDDVDATAEQLRTAGVEVSDPQTQPWGRVINATDPDGHQVLIVEQ